MIIVNDRCDESDDESSMKCFYRNSNNYCRVKVSETSRLELIILLILIFENFPLSVSLSNIITIYSYGQRRNSNIAGR